MNILFSSFLEKLPSRCLKEKANRLYKSEWSIKVNGIGEGIY